ncbi:hypothetical protein E1B28_008468 [Marasmius oreades]|uniref:Uncharacterized protein n=1 Tax=Marasmius oreades TaxID=181124 RepID=A0A9P7RZ56_9AGAR|nr:uncharacterized protein E1B28_008468 [Marasmius oreades]KAG7092092.1 hypothetical protein E1B28_008468 [Marasmius oreades]
MPASDASLPDMDVWSEEVDQLDPYDDNVNSNVATQQHSVFSFEVSEASFRLGSNFIQVDARIEWHNNAPFWVLALLPFAPILIHALVRGEGNSVLPGLAV